jgi:hypothetical protein
MADTSTDMLVPGLTNPALKRRADFDTILDAVENCTVCGRVIEGRHAMIRSQVACVTCAARERDASRRASSPSPAELSPGAKPVSASTEEESEKSSYPLALLYGTGAALVGLAFYASFTIITHFYIGYVAVAVGLMVGKAMMKGSGGVGGPQYQITAVALTYSAITLASIPIHIARLLGEGTAFDWASMSGPLLIGAIAGPFLRLRTGAYGIIGLVILFVGLRVAFRVTRENQKKTAAA